MSNKQLTEEEHINATRSILGSSYDLASGGIPPHAHMLEQIVEGKEMDDYARRTFLSLDSSNLLAIPGLTIYIMEEDKEEAASYFGQDMADNIYTQKKQFRQLATQGTNALLRHHFHTENPWNFEPLSAEEITGMIQEAANREYLPGIRTYFDEWKPSEWSKQGFSSMNDFVLGLHRVGAEWTKEGMEALFEADKLWLTEPLYSRAIELYTKKLGLMNQLLRYAIGKVNELGFADVNVFNPATYFRNHSDTPVSQWEESFQKNFGKSVPGAANLLQWSEGVIKRIQEKYPVNPN